MKSLTSPNLVKFLNWFFRKKIVLLFFILITLNSCNSVDSLYRLKNEYLKAEQSQSFLKPYGEFELSSKPVVEYFLDEKDSLSLKYFKHYKKLCDYTKIPFNFKSIAKFNATGIIENSTKIVIVKNTKHGTYITFCSINELYLFIML